MFLLLCEFFCRFCRSSVFIGIYEVIFVGLLPDFCRSSVFIGVYEVIIIFTRCFKKAFCISILCNFDRIL